MRTPERIFAIGLAFLGVFACLGAVTSHAEVKDLGEICTFSNYDGVLGRPPELARFGVLAYGANQQHILLTGASYPAHGTALVIDDQIVVTLNSSSVAVSGDLQINRFGTTHMVLGASTLTGRFTTMVTQTSPTQLSETLTGQVQVVRCP